MMTPETRIPFNKPFIAGKELYYVAQAVSRGNIGADGDFTAQCSQLLEDRFGLGKVLLTNSCTAALELSVMLGSIGPGDEVLLPSFTFVSTANAVVRTGARPVFVDIRSDTLNLDETRLLDHVTPQTKAILPVHYAGVACEMDTVLEVARSHDMLVIEDAAQGVNAFYRGQPLGSLGQLGAYSFHETKNYICGEGGALTINSPEFVDRAEILRQKGTNRSQFLRGQVDKYRWVDSGSSYAPSEIVSAFLLAQLELIDQITRRREGIFRYYQKGLQELESQGHLRLPFIPPHCQTNFHLFYLLLANEDVRDRLIEFLASRNIQAVFHYVPLHSSPMGQQLGYREGDFPITEDTSRRLLRLPLFNDITDQEMERVVTSIQDFFRK